MIIDNDSIIIDIRDPTAPDLIVINTWNTLCRGLSDQLYPPWYHQHLLAHWIQLRKLPVKTARAYIEVFCKLCLQLHVIDLDQVLAGVEEKNYPTWNDGHVYISNDAVVDAYLTQFKQDFKAFLGARAEEIIPGGCMFITLLAHNSADIKEQCRLGVGALYLEEAFEELANEGLIGKEKLDFFNIPFYGPTMEELQSIVETNKSFEIKSMRLLSGFPLHPLLEVREGEEDMFGRMIGNFYWAMFENIVGTHLGLKKHLVDEIFWRIAQRAAAKYGEFLPNTLDVVVAFLVHKEFDSL